jgi:hypothetical protein
VIEFAIVLASLALGMAGTSAYFTRKLIRILVTPIPAIRVKCLFCQDAGCPECCERCNYDTHKCPGCGKPLKHGTEVCTDCKEL